MRQKFVQLIYDLKESKFDGDAQVCILKQKTLDTNIRLKGPRCSLGVVGLLAFSVSSVGVFHIDSGLLLN